jgi:hypothetical protein
MLGSAALGALLVPASAAAERTVFVNLDPVMVVNTAGQDPTQNSYSTMGFTPGLASGWPALTEGQRTELLYLLKEASVPFDIVYTFERPAAGSYDMVVLGTAADNAAMFPALGCSPAIGLADCSDGNLENISFLFWGCMNVADQADMHRVAFNLFAATGFGWGLENLTGTGQIMAGYSATSLEFGDTCTNISGASICAGGHVGCAANQQNSTADLLARIGARVDDGPPTVTILSPEDGTVVAPDIEVTAAVGDLFGGLVVQLDIVEAGVSQIDERPPYRWNLAGVPQGNWTLQITATDADLNVVSQQVSVCVDLPACGEEPADSTGADGTSTGADDTGGDEFSTEVFDPSTSASASASTSTGEEPEPVTSGAPLEPTSFGGDTPDTGCQCRARAQGSEGSGAASILLLLLGALPRRRLIRRG